MIIDDVVRALECCKDGRCDICGRQGQMADERMCRFDLLEHAYHVIGCQKKEIDKLTTDVDALEKGVKTEKERADALALRWIPVTERLPDVNKTKSGYEETTVIVTVAGCKKSLPMVYERACVRGKTVCRWKWIWGRIYDWNPITHWMPLPGAPGGDAE